MVTKRLLWCVAILTVVHGYRVFQDKIPNGKSVPNPCNTENVWEGVGHINQGGGGDRNPFGLDFKQNGFVWTQDMCRADSDGDGRSNGAELGDPDCTWREGLNATTTTGLTHPGVCEPIDSADCKVKNSFLDCDKTSEFVCDAIAESGIIEFEARLTETAVPAQETTYICQSFEFDITKDYHVVAAKPIIDNINVMHHAVIYGCSDDVNVTKYETPQSCFMEQVCSETLFVWAFGGSGTCVHKNAGFRVGANGYKRVILEMHWNNPYEVATYRDSSGMTLYMTPNLRPHDAGTMIIGQNILVIPPGKESVTANGTCTSMCTEEMFEGSINIFGALNHMHFLGHSIVSKLWSGGDEIVIANDEKFDYNSPKYHSFDELRIAYPGDELTVECNFKSKSRSKTTFEGFGSQDEMCYTFLMYYPKQNGTASCTSSGNIAECEWSKKVWGGCDQEYMQPTYEKAQKVYSDVGENCKTTLCLEECKDVVRELRKNPCFQYPMTYISQKNAYLYAWNNPTAQLQTMEFYYKLDSCGAELEREAWMKGGGKWPDYASGSGSINLGFFVSMTSVILALIM